jgi:hypothetical protein
MERSRKRSLVTILALASGAMFALPPRIEAIPLLSAILGV